MTPRVLVVMGVSGSGKTTVGTQLAARLGWDFKEGDELHPLANIAKMHRGEALTDADRAPWLAAVAAWIDAWIRDEVHGVITCSALKRSYRRDIANGRPSLAFVFLQGRESVLARRLARRADHFMPVSLLKSQLATLEAPALDEPVIRLDSDQPVASQVEEVIEAMARLGVGPVGKRQA